MAGRPCRRGRLRPDTFDRDSLGRIMSSREGASPEHGRRRLRPNRLSGFAAGVALMATNGVSVLILEPERRAPSG